LSLKGTDLVSLADFSRAQILCVLDAAAEMAEAIGFDGGPRSPLDPLDSILATLFFEPSTRTRLSFESAMLRLGGQTLGFAEASSSSIAKGETLADTARMISAYADIIVIRHPLAGAAKVMADFSDKPVINAGDGAREHPTQTLTDLFTIRRELGTLSGLKVGLAGDLKYGRTVHSLAPVMAQFGSDIVCISPEALRMPADVLDRVQAAGKQPTETDSLADAIAGLDVVYMTRVQRERFPSDDDYQAVKGCCNLTPELMAKGKEALRVLHPLPRVDEIDPGVDADKRAAYFRQAAGGVPVRMALIALLLGVYGESKCVEPAPPAREPVASEQRCANPKCITSTEGHLQPVCHEHEGKRCCAYCEAAL